MSVEETILFGAVIVLAMALVAVVVGPKLKASRRRRAELPAPPQPMAAVAVENAAAEIAEELPEPPAAATSRAPTPPQAWGPLVCPTCRRQFAVGLRFCPYDARLLAAVETPGAPAGALRESTTEADPTTPTGKICPSCARRYEMVAVVCARDGAPLVSVN